MSPMKNVLSLVMFHACVIVTTKKVAKLAPKSLLTSAPLNLIATRCHNASKAQTCLRTPSLLSGLEEKHQRNFFLL